MNYFDNLDFEDQNENTLIEHKAWVCVLYCCVFADQNIATEELMTLNDNLSKKKKFSGTDIDELVNFAIKERTSLGQLKTLNTYCHQIPLKDRETLFCIAVEICFADGELHSEERNLLELISSKLELSVDITSKIIEVIYIKNKGNIINKE